MKENKKRLRKLQSQIKGITLIALVVTIIVLLILAAVAINLTIGNNGIFTRAGNATQKWKEASKNEQDEMDKVSNFLDAYLGGTEEVPDDEKPGSGDGETEIIPIGKDESKVGCYMDVEGDGNPDGIIYADLAFEANGSWGISYSNYFYYPKYETTDYYISQKNYNGPWGVRDVVTPIQLGIPRFYIMELEDIWERNKLLLV